MKKSWLKLALWLLPGLSAIASADYGPRYVERELPILYRVALQNLAYDRTQLLFKEWTVAEVTEFQELQAWYVDRQIPKRGIVPAPIDLFTLAGEKMFSSLGELYGASMLRARARTQRSLHYLSEATYRRINWGSYRNPDGLLYRFDADNLHIVSVLESKLGRSARVSDSQTQGLIDQWSTRGIHVLDASGKVRFFSNRNIFLGEKDSPLPVQFVNTTAVKSVMTLVSHRERPDFPGYVLPPPFLLSTEEISFFIISKRYFRTENGLVGLRKIAPTSLRGVCSRWYRIGFWTAGPGRKNQGNRWKNSSLETFVFSAARVPCFWSWMPSTKSIWPKRR